MPGRHRCVPSRLRRDGPCLNRLVPLAHGLSDDHLLRDPRLLLDDRLLRALGELDRLIPERLTGRTLQRTIHRPSLDLDSLLAQPEVLLARLLYGRRVDPHLSITGITTRMSPSHGAGIAVSTRRPTRHRSITTSRRTSDS